MDTQLNRVPDPLIERTKRDLQEVYASATQTALPPEMKEAAGASPFTLAVIAAILGAIAWIIAEFSNYQEIKKNWSTYRCMPSVMPFAAFYGQNLGETMRFCTGEAVREHAPGVIDPIIAGINKATGVVEGVYDEVKEISGGITDLMTGFENFVVGFMNSFRLIGTRVRMTFVRMKSIFDRVYGVFLSFSFAAISAITFGQNMVCNPMVTFMGEITGVDTCCFAPNTMIRMEDGSSKEIHRVRIGDRLFSESEEPCLVTGVFQFDGKDVPMVTLNGVEVSGNHRLNQRGRWLPASAHPLAIPSPSLTSIICLNTSNHRMPVGAFTGDPSLQITTMFGSKELLWFTDYEETEDPVVVLTAKRLAEHSLDVAEPSQNTDYSLGLDPRLHVVMEDDSWRLITDVRPGDHLKSATNPCYVTGIAEEIVDSTIKIAGTEYLIGASQIIRSSSGSHRASTADWTVGPSDKKLRHLFVTGGEFTIAYKFYDVPFMWQVRDYSEAAISQVPYDAFMDSTVA